MKILIVKPRSHIGNIRMERLVRCEPLELEYLFTVLINYDTRISDCSERHDDCISQTRTFRPDIVLFTGYIIHRTIILNDAKRIKHLLPSVRIFVGGVHAEVCPEHFDSPYIDGVFFANQLNALEKTVQRIAEKRAYDDVPGMALRKGSLWKRNVACPIALSDLRHPERVIFNRNPKKYSYLHYEKCASVKTAYGCTGRCTFCFCREMNTGIYSARPLTDVVEEISSIPAETIFIVDDNFLIDEKRIETFANMIIEKNIRKKFIAYGTASFVAHHEALILKLKKAGLDALIIGLEFVDDAKLKEAGKSSTRRDNDRAIQILNQNRIDLFALFIVSPNWRHDDFRKLTHYVKSRAIRFATFSTATVFPGTEDYRRFKENGQTKHEFWRYDLLRIQEKPRYISTLRYYLWLYYLYLLPGLHLDSIAWLVRRCGVVKTARILCVGAFIGAEYLLKLLIWR